MLQIIRGIKGFLIFKNAITINRKQMNNTWSKLRQNVKNLGMKNNI